MIKRQKIQETYIDYVLTHGEQPKSVYDFVKLIKIAESEFYENFASFNAIEKGIWNDLINQTILEVRQQEIWSQYSSREKVLSFFFSLIELLKSHRSYVVYSLKKHKSILSSPTILSDVKEIFEEFCDEVITEGLESGELADRKFLSNRYKNALWIQFGFILNFWVSDDSDGFEKTDEAIEKGINLSFDLFQRSPIDTLFEYGKFMARNSKFKEKMNL